MTVAGEGALSVLSRRLDANNGETLDDPPRATETRFDAGVVSLLRFLAGLAEAAYELPQER